MPKIEKNTTTSEDYLTLTAFAKKHGISTKDKDNMDSLNRAAEKLSRIYITTKAGNKVQTVYRNRKSHSGNSLWRIPPFSEEPVLQEYNHQELIKIQKAKKVAHEI